MYFEKETSKNEISKSPHWKLKILRNIFDFLKKNTCV